MTEASTTTAAASTVLPLSEDAQGRERGGEDGYKSGTHLLFVA